MDKAWTSARHLPTPCPHSPLSRPHPHRSNNMILVITMHGRLRRRPVCQDRGGAAACLMRSMPPRPIPHCKVTRARLRSQPAGRWPAPSSAKGETTPQTRERSASAPGPSRPESRSSNAGIPVKCSRNRRQVRRNPQRPASSSGAPPTAGRWTPQRARHGSSTTGSASPTSRAVSATPSPPSSTSASPPGPGTHGFRPTATLGPRGGRSALRPPPFTDSPTARDFP